MISLHKQWKSSGGVTNSTEYKAYSNARASYHSAVKRVVRDRDEQRSQAIANNLANCSSKDFWSRLRKAFPSKSQTPPVIGSIPSTNKVALCNAWADKFGSTFSKYIPAESCRNLLVTTSMLRNTEPVNSSCFTQENITASFHRLSLNKAAGPDDIAPELLRYAPVTLAVHLSLLFRACERHSYLPDALSEAHVHPVPKPHKDWSKLDSYRPITIGSMFGKIFEICIMSEYSQILKSSNLQFGFKEGSGTAHCTMSVKAVANHYTSRGSKVYAALLDASSAFDRVNFASIFQKLLSKGVPSSVVKLLFEWYRNTQISVTWQKHVSSTSFGIEHGVRQGGLLSPALFALLYDSLLVELENSGVGCHVARRFVAALAYADDLILLAPSVRALNILLQICHSWARRNRLLFNAQKSVGICFSGPLRRTQMDESLPITLAEDIIPTSNQVIHLGHILRFDLSDSAEVMGVARNFNKQFHGFFQKFAKLRKRELLIPLFNAYCSSFYGLDALFCHKATPASIRFLRKSVNLALMRLLNLPPEPVSPHLIADGILNLDTIWKYRSSCFWKNILSQNHPFKDLLVSSFSKDIFYLSASLEVIPYSLALLSRHKLRDICILQWMDHKLT
jgi:hypothetical protein